MTAPVGIDLLRDPAALVAADTAGLLPAAGCAGAQVRAVAAAMARFPRQDRPRAVVVLGPTAAVDAALLSALLGPRAPAPVVAATELPGWVGPLDLVVVLAARRDDDACARGAAVARRRGATVHVRGAADGPVALAAEGDLHPVEVAVPEALAGPGRLAVLAAAAAAAGLCPDPGLDAVADLLDAVALAVHPSAESFTNPAANLAEYLLGAAPVLVGVDPVGDALAAHGVTALAELTGIAALAVPSGAALLSPLVLGRIAAPGPGADLFADPDDDAGSLPAMRAVLLADRAAPGESAASGVLAALRRALPRAPLVEPAIPAPGSGPGSPSRYASELPTATPVNGWGRALAALVTLDVTATYLGLAYGQRRPPDHPEGLGRTGGALWAVRTAPVDPGAAWRDDDGDDGRDFPDASGRMTDLWN